MTTTTLDPQNKLTSKQAETARGFEEYDERLFEIKAEQSYNSEPQPKGMSASGGLSFNIVNEGPVSPADLSGMISLTDLPPAEIVNEGPVVPEQLVNVMGGAWSAIEKTTSILNNTVVETKEAVTDLGNILIGRENSKPIQTPEDVKKKQAAIFHNENFNRNLTSNGSREVTMVEIHTAQGVQVLSMDQALPFYGINTSASGAIIIEGGKLTASAETVISDAMADAAQRKEENDSKLSLATGGGAKFMGEGEMLKGGENPQHFTKVAG